MAVPPMTPTPLQVVLARACAFAKRHGVDDRIAPDDFGLQYSSAGHTHATYVYIDAEHAVSVVIRRNGTTTFAVAQLDWLHNDHSGGRPPCTDHCGECPECHDNPCTCPDAAWAVYRDSDGHIRRRNDGMFVAGGDLSRETIERNRAVRYDGKHDGLSERMRKLYTAAIELIDQEEAQHR
ncbi:hypothetical protein [Nocardia wallacei]|uniref:hypothetical protein n=1 Tax=Nocardia wallacei TaxID=480035 RepID=UPI002454F433|nr:hypothetical protein [Nocardia wallacei]